MTDVFRRKVTHPDGTAWIPASWKRFTVPGLPHGVTVLAIPLVGTTWYSRGSRYWRLRIGLAVLLCIVSACYLALYALILWSDHKRNGYSPAYWITLAVIIALTLASVLDSLLSRRKALSRTRELSNPLLRAAASFLRTLMILVLRFLTPGLYLVALFETARPRPANEWAAHADLEAQLAARARPVN